MITNRTLFGIISTGIIFVNSMGSFSSTEIRGEMSINSYDPLLFEERDLDWKRKLQFIGKTNEGIYVFAKLNVDKPNSEPQYLLFAQKERIKSFAFDLPSPADEDEISTHEIEYFVNKGTIPLEEDWTGRIELQGNQLFIEYKGIFYLPNTSIPPKKIVKTDPFPFSFSHPSFIDPKVIRSLFIDQVGVIYPDELHEIYLEPYAFHDNEILIEEGEGDFERILEQFYFQYKWHGQTEKGIHVLQFYHQDNDVACPRCPSYLPQYTHYPANKGLLFLAIEQDICLSVDWENQILYWNQPRTYIRRIGHATLSSLCDIESCEIDPHRLFILYRDPLEETMQYKILNETELVNFTLMDI